MFLFNGKCNDESEGTMKPHKHAELIKAWADGATIQRLWQGDRWLIDNEPDWNEFDEYRIKPEPKPDVVRYAHVGAFGNGFMGVDTVSKYANLKLTFDGGTGELWDAKVLK